MELKKEAPQQDPDWSCGIAVGSESFINEINNKLGVKAEKRKIINNDSNWILPEPGVPYN
jgi:hypothetical protein